MKISLIDMGRTKKRNVRESIISILSREFPLSLMKIYNKVKKDYSLDVTYQAVFKVVKEMLNDGIIERREKEYQLNVKWIKELENELDIIKKSYVGDSKESSEDIQRRINEFVAKIGPKIKEWISQDPACVIGVSGGGRLFGLALFKYLLREGIAIKYFDINWIDKLSKGKNMLNKEDVSGKKLILIDSEIYSGRTYETVMAYMNKVKNKYNLKGIKFVVDRDTLGLADFSREGY